MKKLVKCCKINKEPIVYHWTYKMDEINLEEIITD